jgi:hypothetical protein
MIEQVSASLCRIMLVAPSRIAQASPCSRHVAGGGDRGGDFARAVWGEENDATQAEQRPPDAVSGHTNGSDSHEYLDVLLPAELGRYPRSIHNFPR